MMEVTTEEAFSGPTDYAGRIAKRKRTKRQRLQSPYHFGTASSPSNDDGSHDHVINNNNHTVVSTDVRDFSPTSSNEVEGMSTLGEEEDMANCLILLAQGHSKLPQKQAILQQDVADLKFNSKRYLEASTGTGGNKIGYYVYECKTCSRTFPSFQALGGHRASHKKPNKAATEEKKHRHQFGTSSDDEESAQFKGHIVTSSALSLQLSSRNVFFGSSFSNKHPKVHECSICGAEFASGQALGGHMRRHRTPAGTNIGLSQNLMNSDSEESPARARNNIVSLDLDLNLPAPDEDDHDDHKETQVSLSSKKQKQQEEQQENGSRLVFPVPALVDCHY